jgi:hydroxymethylpyrimidine pyrophosphatase-like HAD family hydrolase
MRFVALAADFDGTLAADGVLDPATTSALERLRRSGRELILVTGREVPELVATCPELGLFSLVVAENGALLYWPATERYRLLAEPPPHALVDALCALDVAPLSVGKVIVATWHPHEATVLETIRHLGLEYQVIFNKGAVMVLPPGINKASGLTAALYELGLSRHNVVGIGDAENDHSFLSLCECAVAVDNALPTLKQRADFVTSLGHGAGVVELIDELLATDLQEREPLLHRHNIPLGTRSNGEPVSLRSHDVVILIAGPPVSGKSTLALGLMERLTERGYQICVVDPEGDYEAFGEVKVEVRRVRQATARVAELLELPTRNVCVDLLGLSMTDRPRFGADLLSGINALQQRTARPHWLVLDEAHHLFPFKSSAPPERPPGLVLVTVDIDGVSQAILAGVDVVIATGAGADVTVRAFYQAIGEPVPTIPPTNLNWGEALVSLRDASEPPFPVCVLPTRTKHRRHRRKYDIGDVGAGRGFYFRGPWNGGDHYAPNLSRFTELAVQVGDEVWHYHLHRGDYERWFRDVIRDDDLAGETAQIVALVNAGSPIDSRQRVRTAIIDRYAGPS